MNRRKFFLSAAALALLGCGQSAAASVLEVVKTPWCGCCGEWVERMKDAGFEVTVRNVEDLSPIARDAGVPDRLRSCHTAMIGGYAIEGHVPAADIRRLLRERPDAVGLSVPGMPAGSPGMEMPGRADIYRTVLIRRDGKHQVWATHRGTLAPHYH